MANTIKVGYDISDVRKAAEEFSKSLQNQSNAVIQFGQKLERFNREGVRVSEILTGISQSGERVVVTLRSVEGSMKAGAVSIKDSTDRLRELKNELQAVKDKGRIDLANQKELDIRKIIPTQNLDTAELNKVERNIQRIKDVIAKTTIEGARFDEILKKLIADAGKPIVGLNSAENKIAESIRNLLTQPNQTKAVDPAQLQAQKDAADKARQSLATTFPGVPTFSASQVKIYESALLKINELIAANKVSITDFQRFFTILQQDPKTVFSNITDEQRRLVDSIRQVIAVTNDATAAENKRAAASAQRAARQASADTAEKSLRSGLDTSKLDIAKLNAVEIGILRIRKAIIDGKLSLEQFNAALAALKKDPRADLQDLIPNLNPQAASAINAIRSIAIESEKELPGRAAEAAKKFYKEIVKIKNLLEAVVIKKIANAVISEFQDSVKAAATFSIKIAEIQTISQDASLTTEQWAAGINRLSNEFGNPRTDVAEAAYQSISNQVTKGAKTFEFLNTVLRFSKATVVDAATSTNLISSALNSFHLETDQAEKVAASFFKTIELGRVRGTELSAVFGRVGPTAHAVGISMDEVNAAIATLTINGVSAAESATQLNNIFQKLIKPTTEMKQLFLEYGFANVEAAIASGGLLGILKIFNEEAKKGSTRIGELSGNVRGQRGIFGLVNESLVSYSNNLKDITNASQNFNKAVDIVTKSAGQKYQIELERIKNYFVETFGTKTITLVAQAGEALGPKGLAGALEKIGTIIKAGLGIFIAYKVGVIAGNLNIVASNALAAASYTNVTDKITKSLVASRNFIKNNAAGLTGIAAFVGFNALPEGGTPSSGIDDLQEEFDLKKAKKIANEKSINDFLLDEVKKHEQKETDISIEASNQRYAIILKYTQNIVKASEVARKSTIENSKEIGESLKVTSKTFFDDIQRRVNDVTELATRAKTSIKESLRQEQDIPRRNSDTFFNNKLQFAEEGRFDGIFIDTQKANLIRNRITELTNEAKAKFKEGTIESVQEARKLYDEVGKLQGQLFTDETNLRRKKFDEDAKAGKIAPDSFDANGQARFKFIVQTAQFEQKINELTKERLKLEEDFRLKQEKFRQEKIAEAEKEKERERSLQLEVGKVLDIRKKIFDENGKLTPGAKADPSSFGKELEDRINTIRKLTEGEEGATKENFKFFSDLQKERLALVKEIESAIQTEKAQALQLEIARRKEADAELIKSSRSAIEKNKEALKETIEQLNKFEEVAARAATSQAARFDKIDFTKAGLVEFLKQSNLTPTASQRVQDAVNEQKTIAGSEAARLVSIQKLTDFEKAKQKLADEPNIENAKKLKEAYDELTKAVDLYIQKRTGGDITNKALPGEDIKNGRGVSIAERFKAEGEAQVQKAIELATAQENLRKNFDDAKNRSLELNDVINKLPPTFIGLGQAGADAGERIKRNMIDAKTTLQELGAEAARLNAAFDQLNQKIPILKEGGPGQPRFQPIGGQFFGGMQSYFNDGGMIGPKPRGSDQRLIRAADGEFIVNQQSTKQFYPLLQAINSQKQNVTGQSSVTNVGDITVNVAGGNTDEMTLRRIGQGLRREIQRGTISFK